MNTKTLSYIVRRFFFYLLAGFMAISLNFFIPRLMPGDPASIMFAQFRGKMKIEQLQALKQTFGFPEAEPFVDLNENLKWDSNEQFTDWNNNQKYDSKPSSLENYISYIMLKDCKKIISLEAAITVDCEKYIGININIFLLNTN